jgi:hypothetical protein
LELHATGVTVAHGACSFWEGWTDLVALRKSLLRLLPLALLSALPSSMLFARAVPYEPYPLKIQILSSEFTPQDASAEFPPACDLKHYSEACYDGKTRPGTSVIELVDSWGRKHTFTCHADAEWSNCSPLPEKAYFKGRKHKKGYTIVYPNPSGEKTPHFYPYSVDTGKRSKSSSGAKAEHTVRATVAPTGEAAAAEEEEPEAAQEMIRCSITSTPAGAEITIDGHYVGNTPSDIGLPPGKHAVAISMPGYGDWRRELRVTPQSTVNVTARLQESSR